MTETLKEILKRVEFNSDLDQACEEHERLTPIITALVAVIELQERALGKAEKININHVCQECSLIECAVYEIHDITKALAQSDEILKGVLDE